MIETLLIVTLVLMSVCQLPVADSEDSVRAASERSSEPPVLVFVRNRGIFSSNRLVASGRKYRMMLLYNRVSQTCTISFLNLSRYSSVPYSIVVDQHS